MQNIMKLTVCYVLFFGTLFAESEILCLSFPRSGTHWSLYCLSFLLEKNVIVDRGMAEVRPFKGKLGTLNNGNIYAAHNAKDLWIQKDHNHKDVLVLVLRNYREAMLRDAAENVKDVVSRICSWKAFNYLDNFPNACFIQARNSLINNIRCYDKWDPDKRILIHLEDLIDDPRKELSKVLKFFDKEHRADILENFLNNIDMHKDVCLGIYGSQGGSKSKGEDHLYHTKKAGEAGARKIDKVMRESFPYYFEKYLKRYELK